MVGRELTGWIGFGRWALVRSRSLLGTQHPPARTAGNWVSLWAVMDGTVKSACQIAPLEVI